MDKRKILLAPSILSADFSNMERDVKFLEENGGDWIHVDVMDGSFVPNMTFGAKMVKDLRPHTKLTMDVHLMVDNPDRFIEDFASAGSDYITVHYEAMIHVHRCIQNIISCGCKPGISIIPSTPISFIEELLPFVDLVLVMSVNPGFGGQKMLPFCLDKVKKLDVIRKAKGYNYLISVDGGINPETAGAVRDAGVDIMVSGSAFFTADNPAEAARLIKGGV